MTDLEDRVSELAKRRGFYSQTAEAYGGVGGFQTFGPHGAELKRNIEDSWREKFSRRLGHREIEAPTIMPKEVFEASGHLQGFDDMIIDCPECETSSRADHLVENETDLNEAEGLSIDRIEQIIRENSLGCPNCGSEYSKVEVEDFNLMFETSIGPGSSQPGYLRPETAQGIFIEFPRFKEYMRNQLPFGITQIGKAYRNEISPRKGLVRIRELTQAELEHFIDPEDDEPNISDVEDVELKLYSRERQEEDGSLEKLTVKEAVEEGVVESDWIAYYLGLAKEWFESIGVDMDRFRFRQHQNDELSHYAKDCWDAEADIGEKEPEWLEIAGFSYRGCYDLSKHRKYSNEDFRIFKEFDETREIEKTTVKPDMGYLGPKYGDKAKDIAKAVEEKVINGSSSSYDEEIEIKLEGERIAIPLEKVEIKEEVVEKEGKRIVPHVVEPSFGVDRTLYTVMSHAYDQDEIDDEERTVLRFENSIAPIDVAVFPLMDKDGLGAKAQEVADELRENGFSIYYDDSGSIGRRYRRQDEIGTPFCVTVDYETKEENTVTLRDRDSTEQERIPLEYIAEQIEKRR